MIDPARNSVGADLPRVLPARTAYNLVARHYQHWHWQTFWRRNEAPLVLRYVSRLRGIRSVLDVGTGTGLYAGMLSVPGRHVVGLDVSENMLTVARSSGSNSVGWVQADAVALPLRSRSFDLVIAARVFSHVQELAAAVSESARVAREGGYVIITDVDPAHDYRATRLRIGSRDIFIDTYKWSAGQITAFAEADGLELRKIQRLTAKNAKWLPEDEAFHSVDRTGSRAIGHVLIFRRARKSSRSPPR